MKRLTAVLAIVTAQIACAPNQASQAPPQPASTTPADATASAVAPWPEEDYRQRRPTPRPVKDFVFPSVQRFTLDNGIDVFLVKQDKLPTVQLTFQFNEGTAGDPRSKSGMAAVCMDLLSEGTQSLEKIAFEEQQADIATAISSTARLETRSISARTLKAQLGPTLDLVAEMLREPGLRQEDLNRIVEARVASLLQRKSNPSEIARRLFSTLIWGEKHPYGHIETQKSLEAIKLSDCKKHIRQLGPNGAKLWVVGMTSQDELRKELDSRLSFWKGKAPSAKNVRPAKKANGKIHFVHVDGAVQSMIMIGHPGPRRDADDFEATKLMAKILGGSFSSRINMNLREDKGYSYGGRGGFRYRKGGSHLFASSSVETSTTALALREVAKEIAGMRATQPTKEELHREQEGALLALPALFSTATKTLSAFMRVDRFGFPLDYYAGHQARVRAVDAQAVHTAATGHLSQDTFVVLVVGDALAQAKGSHKTVLEEVQALADEGLFGKGGLVHLDADGMPTKRPPSGSPRPGKPSK